MWRVHHFFVWQVFSSHVVGQALMQGWSLPMGQPGQSKQLAPPVHKNLQRKKKPKLCNIVTATSLLN
jgi:hypothetical protein